MLKNIFSLLVLLILLTLSGFSQSKKVVWLDELDLGYLDPQWSKAKANTSMWDTPLRMSGKGYKRGVGTQASSLIEVELNGGSTKFIADVGVDDAPKGNHGTIRVTISADGKTVWESGLLRGEDKPKAVELDVTGVKLLSLFIDNAGSGWDRDLADWGEARFEVTGKSPVIYKRPHPQAYILTPKPSPKPQINGPKVYGVRPNAPFMYRIPCTGEKPVQFAANGLPEGLSLDKKTGIITGKIAKPGEYIAKLSATNSLGKAQRDFKIVVGEKIALTPPLGWSSWNVWGNDIDEKKIKSIVDAMESSGLADHGYTYVNIDDTWQGKRGGKFNGIQPDKSRFPDLKGLIDHAHSLGLKMGIYSTPWKASFANRIGGSADSANGGLVKKEQKIGKFLFHQEEANQYADWGIDYLKYDWYPNTVEHTRYMADALRATGRDIVLSLSPTTPFDSVKHWVELAQLWRTTGDITDTWKSMSEIGFQQNKWAPYAGPGHWNDADMLVVGWLGWSDNTHLTHLTPDEQYTHISLWSLLASPLLIGCDLTKLDDFTLNLLTNDEVLAVDQDPLGIQAKQISVRDSLEVWARPLEDGSQAVGLFNRSDKKANVSISWKELGISGKKTVRDIWRQKDLGKFDETYSAEVPPHGVVLVKIR